MSADRFALQRTKVFRLQFPPNESPWVSIHCSVEGCTKDHQVHIAPQMPPSVVAKRFRRLGWQVDDQGREATCPEHVRHPRSKNKTKRDSETADVIVGARTPESIMSVRPPTPAQEPQRLPTPKVAAAPPAAPAPAPAAPSSAVVGTPDAVANAEALAPSLDLRKAQFRANRLLDEHYQPEQRGYAAGWSDESIAQETGVSPAWVAEIRVAVYGPMEDPAIVVLEGKLAELEKRMEEEYETIRSMLQAAAQDRREQVSKLRAELSAAKLRGLGRAGGVG